MSNFSYASGDLYLTDRTFCLPLNYQAPQGEQIEVFVREVSHLRNKNQQQPYLIFFQGGPGFSAANSYNQSWVRRLLDNFRVLLLDQRGTGASSPVLAQTLAGKTPLEMAHYLQFFRANNIINDAEVIRESLIGDQAWTICGQSFGGFCVLNYLSRFPKSIEKYYITGGIAGIDRSADEIYRATYQQLIIENQRYFQQFPEDQTRVQEIVDYLKTNSVKLPSGDPLSVRKFQSLGCAFGGSGGFASIHQLLAQAFVKTPHGKELSFPFLKSVEAMIPFDTNPIYAILHEAIYADGYATNWSAQRIRQEFPQFDAHKEQPFFFTGEMIYPWMFEEIGQLQSLREAAEILAQKSDWSPLYHRETLRQHQIPGAAIIYYSDMYVPLAYSMEVVEKYLPCCRTWITNEFKHNGIGVDGQRIMDRLMGLTSETITCNYSY